MRLPQKGQNLEIDPRRWRVLASMGISPRLNYFCGALNIDNCYPFKRRIYVYTHCLIIEGIIILQRNFV